MKQVCNLLLYYLNRIFYSGENRNRSFSLNLQKGLDALQISETQYFFVGFVWVDYVLTVGIRAARQQEAETLQSLTLILSH